MKIKKISRIANAILNFGIHTTAIGSGAVVGTYIINRDVMCNQDESMVAGVMLGCGTAKVVDDSLMAVKNTTVQVGKKAVSIVSQGHLNKSIAGGAV